MIGLFRIARKRKQYDSIRDYLIFVGEFDERSGYGSNGAYWNLRISLQNTRKMITRVVSRAESKSSRLVFYELKPIF